MFFCFWKRAASDSDFSRARVFFINGHLINGHPSLRLLTGLVEVYPTFCAIKNKTAFCVKFTENEKYVRWRANQGAEGGVSMTTLTIFMRMSFGPAPLRDKKNMFVRESESADGGFGGGYDKISHRNKDFPFK